MKIKFSHNYKKIANITEARLLEVINVNLQNLSQEFIAYDTENIYKLPKTGEYLMLIFHKQSEANMDSNIFTTIRRRTNEKEKYYRENIGKIFTLEIVDKQHNA